MKNEHIKVGDTVEVFTEGWTKGVVKGLVEQADAEHIWVRYSPSRTSKYHRNSKLIIGLVAQPKV